MIFFPFDAHTHCAGDSPAGVSIVNGTRPGDWGEVARLAEQSPERCLPAFGLHPWYAGEEVQGWEERLEALLRRFPRALVGEVGLDKVHLPRISPERQRDVFLFQRDLADKYGRPLVLHGVRTWPRLAELLGGGRRLPFLCHGYNGPAEMVPVLTEKGAYFSLGPRQWNREEFAGRMAALVRIIPEDRLMLESDGASSEELVLTLEQWSRCRGIGKRELLEQTTANAERFLSLPPGAIRRDAPSGL